MMPLGKAFLLAGVMLLPGAAAKDDRPNIVLLFADDLGYGDLSCFGNPVIRTPNLDRLAAGGLRLTSFYAAQGCVPSRIRLMTGRYPIRTGIRGTSVGGKGGIPDKELTLAEALKVAGYRTGMLGKWHLGYAEEKFLPVGQGFDSWFGLPYSNDMIPPWVKTKVPLWLYENTKRVENPVNQDTLTTRYTERAVTFIKESKDKPFFLYLAYNMPHLPIHTAERFRGRSRAGLYGDVIETLDWSAGQVVQTLRDLGLEKKTLVVFTSDNGPWINPPARMLQKGNLLSHVGSVGLLRGAKGTTYEGGFRVPCIVSWPGRIPAGLTSAEMVASMDLYATFIKAAGGTLPEHHVDGLDLREFLAGETDQSPRKEHGYFAGRRLIGFRAGSWKLHAGQFVRPGDWKSEDTVELFNLDVDPSESRNLASEKPEVVERLKKRMAALAGETGAQLPW